ncbi:7406_t:CDS:2 [Entrophospora sp. SA101]|nr:4836_t:CDS:2 [Entrophospora sp. SA101]CAJ0641046.1 11661_t:CDS:2 [Entrophospora sp. SA101]CAJ0765606.1 7406_t:CDS:2 [Entrophospora sp. SA101]CAJ0823706.1 20557_t:CDS:2 [Entrophospora sp. SA101]CAJ0823710.1 20560_t:CDS:2 [Entrophospora sp. SA101]
MPIWEGIALNDNLNLDYRTGVYIDDKIYLVDLTLQKPVCWIFDTSQKGLATFLSEPMDVKNDYHPVQYPATTVVDDMIYIFGGESLRTGQPTNHLYILKTKTMSLCKMPENGQIPIPRSMPSLDALNASQLALFGGHGTYNGTSYDLKDIHIYDISSNSWNEISTSSNVPYARSLHSTCSLNEKLYIYGGKHISSISSESVIHDDDDTWIFDKSNDAWQRYIAPISANLPLPLQWIRTKGVGLGKRSGAALFFLRNRLVILGGKEKNDFRTLNEENAWEFMKILCPTKNVWRQVRIQGMPKLECLALQVAVKNDKNIILIIGKNLNGELIIGHIRD